jgi:hypothetical protein
MESMEMFYKYLRELVSSYNIDRLLLFKKQLEEDIVRIGEEERLIEKYNAVCKAIEQLTKKKSA